MTKIALVTGAGSGIGKLTSIELSRAGWTVVLSGITKENLVKTDELLDRPGLVVPCDISDPLQVDNLFETISTTYGRLDLLFNNAGITILPKVNFEEVTYEQLTKVVNININGSFLIAQGSFRMMKEQTPQGGRIINNGSLAAHAPRPKTVVYTMTKHAILGLTKCLSIDGRPYNIACGQIDVGASDTTMSLGFDEPKLRVEDIASTVVHMASLPLESNLFSAQLMASPALFAGRG